MKTQEEDATAVRKPEDFKDRMIFIFHKLSRADFCVIVLGLAALDVLWILLPLGAISAKTYWITDVFKRARGWHTRSRQADFVESQVQKAESFLGRVCAL